MNQSFYAGASGAISSMEKMNVISNNIANVNTNAFKPKTAVFSELLNYNLNDSPNAVTELQTGSGSRVGRTYTNFDPAGVLETNSEYDYAILQERAFFMLQDPITSQISYTRNGHFYCSEREDGFYLVTDAGKLVLDQNKEPIRLNAEDVEEEAGEEALDTTEEKSKQILSLYTFANPSNLLSTTNGEYIPVDQNMEPILVKDPQILSHALEPSGTDLAKELTRLIECQHAYSYALKMVTTSDEVEATINTLRG